MFIISIEQLFNGSLIYIVMNTINSIIYNDLFLMESNLPFQTIDLFSTVLWFLIVLISLFLNVFVNSSNNNSITNSIFNSLKPLFSCETFKAFKNKRSVKKYEEIETIDSKEEDISKYNELSRSIIGSLNNLDKENQRICNTSFNSNSKYSSPLIKRKINSSSTKIDFASSTPITSRCSTPKYSTSSQCSATTPPRTPRSMRLDYLDYQSTPNNLLKNVVIQNARYSTSKNKF